jgi:hypothetical protein
MPPTHVLIPADFRDLNLGGQRATFSYGWTNMPGGLDGIALDLPAFQLDPTQGGYIPLNVQVKDPIWPLRNLLDVNFSLKPGEPHTIFFDTRDRILPNDRSLYLTIASAAPGFEHRARGNGTSSSLQAHRDAARAYRRSITQVRDNFANIIEERPNNLRDLYNRFEGT